MAILGTAERIHLADLSDEEIQLVQEQRSEIAFILETRQLTPEQLATTKSLRLLQSALRKVKDLHLNAQGRMHSSAVDELFDLEARHVWDQAYIDERRYMAKWDALEAAIRIVQKTQ